MSTRCPISLHDLIIMNRSINRANAAVFLFFSQVSQSPPCGQRPYFTTTVLTSTSHSEAMSTVLCRMTNVTFQSILKSSAIIENQSYWFSMINCCD